MKNQKLILKTTGIIISLLYLTGCGETNSNSVSQSSITAENPKVELASFNTSSVTETTTKQASQKQAATKPRRVKFKPGTSSQVLKDSVIRGERHTYLVGAKKGQQMNLRISSLEKNAVFDLIAPNGKTLKQEVTTWNSKLPASGDYKIVVGGTRGNATYELRVEIK